MYTDTHCHIFIDNYKDIDLILKNLNKNKVKRIIINGYNLETNKEVTNLIKKYNNVYGSLGIHPNNIEDYNKKSIDFIIDNLNNPKIIAIGEIGLDYYRNKDNKKEQIEMFEKMLNIAVKYKKPIIVHNRQATDDLLRILKNYDLKGIMHSFSGSFETAAEYIKLGYKLGINGIVTFKNTNLRDTLKKIDVKNLLLETDSPYLSPEPLRGKRNEPKNITYIAKQISAIYEVSDKILAQQLEKNFNDVFDINIR